MVESLTVSNCVRYLVCAYRHDLAELTAAATAYCGAHLADVWDADLGALPAAAMLAVVAASRTGPERLFTSVAAWEAAQQLSPDSDADALAMYTTLRFTGIRVGLSTAK